MDDDRIEHDLLGEHPVPAAAHYGIHSVRARANFAVGGPRLSSIPELIIALASVKQAAAEANAELGALSRTKADAIIAACEEIRGGALHDQFIVELIQGGAGTSTNMNANEVIANRALEILGHARGEYQYLHPIDDVNAGQSTNDVYPTALRMALYELIGRLRLSVAELRERFEQKRAEYSGTIKIGRTQLQDAVPMTLGQELGAYAVMLAEDDLILEHAATLICEVNLGGTAIGTGLNARTGYSRLACARLAELSGMPVQPARCLVEASQDVGALVQLSGALKRLAVKLSKICNDLRLLSSGPQAGFGEIRLPAVQAGSSIMPGKVNPVIPELINQIAFEVIGNDVTVSMAAEGGQLQLNAFEPIIAHSLFESIGHLTAGCELLAERCVAGLTADEGRLGALVASSTGVAAALSPYLGYERASALMHEALISGRGVAEIAVDAGLMTPDQITSLLQPEAASASVGADGATSP